MMTENTFVTSQLDDLPGPSGLPIIGNLLQVRLNRLHLTLEDWAEQYGSIFRIRLGPGNHYIVISDWPTIQRILMQRPDMFRRTRMLESVASEMRLKGVFAAEGDDWRRHRRIVTNALSQARLKEFFPTLVVTVNRLQRRWEQAADLSEPVDLCRDLMRFTVDATMQLAFGIDTNTLETPGPVIQQHLDKVFPVLFRRVNAAFPWWRYVRLPADRRLDRALEELRREINRMIAQTRACMAEDSQRRSTPTNFLEAILAVAEDDESGVTDEDIFANVGNLMLAGEDTTANSIAWTVYSFMEHPELFRQARQEVDAVIAPAATIGKMEQANDFPFLDAFCNETMRLKPVAPLHLVEPNEDVDILGHNIPKNTQLMLLVRRMMVQDEIFENGAVIDPDRWLNTAAEAGHTHHRKAFIPFGAGPRLCPGRSFAWLQIRLILVMLLRNFEMERVPVGSGVNEHLAFTMIPTNLWIHLKRRY